MIIQFWDKDEEFRIEVLSYIGSTTKCNFTSKLIDLSDFNHNEGDLLWELTFDSEYDALPILLKYQ